MKGLLLRLAEDSNLPQKENGKDIDYTIAEIGEITGYTTAYDTTSKENTTIITNTHTPDTTERSVEKVWNDNNNQDGIRPEGIEVQLNVSGSKYEAEGVANPVTLNAGNGWTYKWENLPKYKDGTAIEYTVVEISSVTGYTTSSSVEGTKTTITIKTQIKN